MAKKIPYNKLGLEFKHITFSVFDTISHGTKKNGEKWIVTDVRDEVAVEGKCVFRDLNPFHYGEGNQYISKPMENPTWREVGFLADEMVETTGDYHHIFLEGVQVVDTWADGTKIVEFVMGS